MKKIYALALLLPLLTACGDDDSFFQDQEIWEYASPASRNMNEGILLDLDEGIKLQNFGNLQGLLIIKDNRIVFENYYQQNSRVDLFPVGRVGSSLVTLLLGEVLNNELGNQLDTPIHELLPGYGAIFDENPVKKEITIRHLLTMQSGLVWNESLRSVADPNNDLVRMTNSNDYIAYILNQQIEAPPGRRFAYNSGSYYILLKIMAELLDQPINEYFEERLFEPLQIDNYLLGTTPSGLPDYVLGLSMNTLDLAKIGYFTLKKGEWQSRRLVDDRWVDQLLSIQKEISNQNNFGFGWWNFAEESLVATTYGLNDVFYLFGEESQGIYLSESQDLLVVVSNGLDPVRSFGNSSFWAFIRVLDSLQPDNL